MSENLFQELETLSNVSVALEGSATIPADAQKILSIFLGSDSSVSNEADFDNSGSGTLSKLANGALDILKKIIAWVQEKIQEFKAWFKEYRLAIEKTEELLDKTEEALRATQSFNEGKIKLSPMVTGELAVEGVLDKTFPDKMVHLRDILTSMFNIRIDLSKLTQKSIDLLKDALINGTEYEDNQASQSLMLDYSRIGQEIARHLKTVDSGKSMFGGRTFAQMTTGTAEAPNAFRSIEKISDLASLPLPGGYAFASAYVKEVDKSFFGVTDSAGNGFKVVASLIENLSPVLVKTHSSGITFSGDAMDRNGCEKVISEGRNIIAAVKSDKGISSDESVLNDAVSTAQRFEKSKDAYVKYGRSIAAILKASVKIIETDRFKTYNYAMKVVRASLKYVQASFDSTPVEEVSQNHRLPSPSA